MLRNIGEKLLFLNTRNAILMTTSSVFITFDYVIIIWYSHLHVLISELIQSKSALKTQCFRVKKISTDSKLIFSEIALIFQFWTALIHRKLEVISSETELISADAFHVLESALKNAKTQKERCSALIVSGTLIREFWIAVTLLQKKEENGHSMFLDNLMHLI